ncbi:hypothetical protein E2493_15395 [Sphingomonas parva]|uniref:Helicase ATP-binding domain-containing protein n=1 Tax=Sphingomonas parva TaxID=2555898 RepID=A0A4Y8ZMY4_9SPHN|nr:DEAD/DEAH box helicase family protein [Sphingomonas parva]TFI57368.1 hypothetical protein E2493_15395 [Sphingomonas parva]
MSTAAAEATPAPLLARMQFSGTWRDYQQRALEEIDAHLAGQRLHVVAAPGSGKTVLGLELMRRLGRPALVLSPTRTIRDQWPSRLVPHFLPEAPSGEEVSADLEVPRDMTNATYQALHALWADEESDRFARLIASLQAIGPVSLLLDEAHHLRREWWNALQALVDALPGAHLVALTATPPYDAPYSEWARYDALCGPIDLEIGVPELVRNGDLCPHQDHVIFSGPDADTLSLLDRRRRSLAAIAAELCLDQPLLDAFEAHPWLSDPGAHIEAILEAPQMLSAILVQLAAAGRRLPPAPLALLGIDRREVAMPSAFWLEMLLDGLLFRFAETFDVGRERRNALRDRLDALGLLEGRRVRLHGSRAMFRMVAGSLAKIDSIVDIARAEAASLGAGLSMVVLSDHVRAADLPRSASAEFRPAKLGVVPIFETLRRAGIEGQRLAVLTGSLVILPALAERPLRALAERRGLPAEQLQLSELPACPGHLRVTASGAAAAQLVDLVTCLFAQGAFTILIGTQALLGEGWDAPAVNSLVLASNAAAFMLSNQMRGRAIRIDPERPGKVANIWHLATVDDLSSGAPYDWRGRLDWGYLDDGEEIGSDIELLMRRFRAFEGISNWGAPRIHSGVMRLGAVTPGAIEGWNARTFAIAGNRSWIAERWATSLGDASPRAHVREIAAANYAPRILAWRDTLRWLGASAASSGAIAAADEMRGIDGPSGIGVAATALAAAAGLAALPKLARAGWLLVRNGSLEGCLKQVGRAVLDGLNEAGLVSDLEREAAWFEVGRGIDGRRDIIVHDVSRATERAVIEAIAEILGPVRNPRYLLVRTSWLGQRRRVDYHAVPSAIARRREWAEHFHQAWQRRVGTSRLVFTRTAEGRLLLLRARARSFAAGFQRIVDRQSAWL